MAQICIMNYYTSRISMNDDAEVRYRTNTGVDAAGRCTARTYEHDWLLARRFRNASHDGASTMSSARWFQSMTVLTKNECLYCSV